MQVEVNLREIFKGMEVNVERAMLKSAIKVHNNLISKVLRGQRSGYEYPVAGTGTVVNKEKTLANGRKFYYRKLEGAVYYTASAPFEAPASRLGHLRTSYRYFVKGNGFDAIGYVGSDLPYSVMLEKGTMNMHPRPHLSVAFQNSKEVIKKYFRDELTKKP